MKILLFLLAFTLVGMVTNNELFTLTVKITSIENQKGLIEISVYNDAGKFAQVGKTYKMVRIKPDGSELIHQFTNLPAGKYAICTYHDENANKICDKNFLGIPTEAYAFSNNIRPKLAIPAFEDCATDLNKNKSFTIRMVY